MCVVSGSDPEYTQKLCRNEELPEPDARAVVWCVNMVLKITGYRDADNRDAIAISTEVQVPLDSVGIPAGEKGNRIDCLALNAGAGKMWVFDYKFGEGDVAPPEWNLQPKAYAYGALMAFPQGFDCVEAVILQPEMDDVESRVKSAEWDAATVRGFGEPIRGIVEATQVPDAPLVSGPWCTFCRGRDTCPNHRGLVLRMPMHVEIGAHLDAIAPADRGVLYDEIKRLGAWCTKAAGAIEGYAIEGNGVIGGYSVEPTTGNRKWNPDGTEEVMAEMRVLAADAGIQVSALIEPEKPISPAQADKLLGKKLAAERFGQWVKQDDGPLKMKKDKPVKKVSITTVSDDTVGEAIEGNSGGF
jgi:hypothetical protein